MARDRLIQADGNWVYGDRFWDREEDVKLLIERIERGAHVLLVAQRRMGKTSLMKETARRLGGSYVCLFVDLQDCREAPDAIVKLSLAMHKHKSLWTKAREVYANILTKAADRVEKVGVGDLGVTLRAGLTRGDWAEKGDRLLAILAGCDQPVALLLDEVPILVSRLLKGDEYAITPERRRRADHFMSWLRENSIRHQGRVRIVLSGSIGLEPVLRQAKLSSTINNFAPCELKPWGEATALGCLRALANEYGIQFEQGAPREMLRQLGCLIPHHVQMFFTYVHETCRRRGRMEFAAEEVEAVYRSEMLGTRGHAELTHYEERLEMVLGKELFPLALDMLTEASVTGRLTPEALTALQEYHRVEGKTIADARKEILWVLEHDGYLESAAEGYAFVSTLLRDWWNARHGQFYTPALERGE